MARKPSMTFGELSIWLVQHDEFNFVLKRMKLLKKKRKCALKTALQNFSSQIHSFGVFCSN